MDEQDVIPQFRLRDVAEDHLGLQVAMVLVARQDGFTRTVGSAFAVAPGLAITAAHVIDDCMNYQKRRDGYRQHDSVISLTAVQLYGGKVLYWTVDGVYGSVSSDIAFLRFARPKWWGDGLGQIKPQCARLNLNPPTVGDAVRVFGFPDSEIDGEVLYISPSECECRVLKIDVRTPQPTWYMPLSHLELQGKIAHGMSGGPCFDKDWNVIGVNSSGWDGLQLAKMALLWPAMGVEIDLFKTGLFPAIDLFSSGDTRALGYRRVYVTSKKEARFARVDPDTLTPTGYLGMTEHLSGGVEFAASGAQEALAELKDHLAKARGGEEPLNSNKIIRLTRYYFWELEAAIHLAILLAARQANLSIPEPSNWEQVIQAWKAQGASGNVLDEIATLDFDWNGVGLFEIRTYAELARSGIFALQCLVSNDDIRKPVAIFLGPPCWKGGQQLPLPDGLDRFMDAGRRFVQRLLRLSAAAKAAASSPTA